MPPTEYRTVDIDGHFAAELRGVPLPVLVGARGWRAHNVPAIPHHRRKYVVVGRSVNDPIDWLVNTHPRKECSCLRQLTTLAL